MRFRPLALLLLLTACSGSFLSEAHRLDGTWGGYQARMIASHDSLILQVICSRDGFSGPVVPKDGGYFEAYGRDQSLFGVNPGGPVHLTGTVRGDTATILLAGKDRQGNWAPPSTFTVVAGQERYDEPGSACVD